MPQHPVSTKGRVKRRAAGRHPPVPAHSTQPPCCHSQRNAAGYADGAALSHREPTTVLTTTMTTAGLPDTFTSPTRELVSSLVVPSACAYGSEGSRKSVVVYSTPMTRNRPELPGSGRSRWTTNHLVTQQKIRSNRTYPDLWVANPLVAGSSPAPQRMSIEACQNGYRTNHTRMK